MSLAVTRVQLKSTSGRYDLTDTDWLVLANRACRTLDTRVQTREESARSVHHLAAGDDRVRVSNLRSLRDVWIHSTSGSGAIKCDLSLNSMSDWRSKQNIYNFDLEIFRLLGVVTPVTIYDRIYCLESPDRTIQTMADTTIVTKVNLTNTLLSVATSPPAPTTLAIVIEDGQLLPSSPHLSLSAGSVTIVGTDEDDVVLTEEVDCSRGAGNYTTTSAFKTVVSVTTADFDHLMTDDEKITVATGRLSFIQDLNLNNQYDGRTLLFYPALAEEAHVEVIGRFWSDTLIADGDVNFWTENYPEALEWQVMKVLEVRARNRAGLDDWNAGLDEIIFSINKEFIMSVEDSSPNSMKG